jgi:5-methyltetrahydrofolate--homocysteine methyltransferase
VRTPFLDFCRQHVAILDGAMGSNLQCRPLDLRNDWMGHENISEVLNFSRPDIIQEIHELFLEVGCDGVETNTFGANKIVMAEADMAGRVFECNKTAVEIARRACDKFETPDRPKYVFGSIGPGTKILTLGMVDWATMEDSYYEQVRGLLAGGADVLLVETAGHAGREVHSGRGESSLCRDWQATAHHGAVLVRPKERRANPDRLRSLGCRLNIHAL